MGSEDADMVSVNSDLHGHSAYCLVCIVGLVPSLHAYLANG